MAREMQELSRRSLALPGRLPAFKTSAEFFRAFLRA